MPEEAYVDAVLRNLYRKLVDDLPHTLAREVARARAQIKTLLGWQRDAHADQGGFGC